MPAKISNSREKEEHFVLKPCPFCGGEPVFVSSDESIKGPNVYPGQVAVQCKRCWIETIGAYSTFSCEDRLKFAAEIWNKRV